MKEYRISAGRRWSFGILGLVFAIPSLVATVVGLVAVRDEWRMQMIVLALGGGFFMLGLGCLLSVVRSRIRLFDDAIERQGAFRLRRMNLADVAGRRVETSQYGSFLVLASRTSGVRDLRLEKMFATDAAFDEWMRRIPDLDAQELQRSTDDYLADEGDHAPREEKVRRLKAARLVARIAQYATFAAVVWVFIYPEPYDLAVLIIGVIPIVAIGIAAAGQGAYTLEGRRNDARASLVAPMILPGLALMMRAMIDQQVLDWQTVLWFAGAVTVICVGLLFWASPDFRRSKLSAATAVILTCPYGYGAVAIANSRLDGSPPTEFTTRVIGKHSSSGKSTTYYLDVAPWGPRAEHGDVMVTRGFYDRSLEGSTVCVYLWPGALGARWFQVGDCPVE